MNYLGKFIDNFKYVYKEINPATLTGAIDVIVVEQPDGTFTCSPFHVRFGKIGVLRSREKIVEIEINGELCDIHMKLGESGEAFFVEELLDEDPSMPQHLVCSPIPYADSQEEKSDSAVWTAVSNNKEFQESISELVEDVPLGSSTLKTFHAKTVQSLSDCEIPATSEFRPIRSLSEHEGYQSSTEIEKSSLTKLNHSDNNLNVGNKPSGTKKKRRRKRKTLSNEFNKKEHDSKHDESANTKNMDEFTTNPEETSTSSELNKTNSLKKDDTFDDEIANLDLDKTQTSASIASDLHFFSDTDAGYTNHDTTKPYTPAQSDTEFEVSTRPKACEDCAAIMVDDDDDSNQKMLAHRPSWRWGELPSPLPKSEISELPRNNKESTSKEQEQAQQRSMLASMLGFMKKTRIRNNELEGSIYLSQLDAEELDPEIARLYLPHCRCMDSFKQADESRVDDMHHEKDEDVESGNGPSLAHSPVSEVETSESPVNGDLADYKDDWDIAMSLCGGGGGGGGGGGLNSETEPTFEQFNQHLITYEQFANDTAIFKNPNLIFRINGKMYNWEAACPLLLSFALFKKPLPPEVVDRLEIEKVSKVGNVSTVDNNVHRKGYYSWFYWTRTTQNKTVAGGNEASTPNMSKTVEMDVKIATSVSSSGTFENGTPASLTNDTEDFITPQENIDKKRLRTYSSTDSELEADGVLKKDGKLEKYRKTLRLTSEQIAKLNLQPGDNEIVFSVTTAYQGTTRCKCALFLWRYDDKIVISDIDGTITKSDVLGHIMPIVGNAWAQSGVAKLFNRIEDNGYKLLYLSARAIGQSKGTRRYLNSIKQEDLKLPEGPLLLNPTSLLSAFHREVIEKKPEEFKISCLRDILALFPPGSNPFYAGYGNKINDVWTYQAVGIPMFRIFTINHKGELRHEFTKTFQSSYLSMSQIADQLFPVHTKQTPAEEFSEFNYWRNPIPSIDEMLKES